MAAVSGKDCFRRKWLDKPIYSGGNVTSIVLPNAAGTYLTAQECFVTACGAEINICTVDGTTLASYRNPVGDDVVLNVTAVTALPLPDELQPSPMSPLSKRARGKSVDPDAFPAPDANRGVYVAASTRNLQITVLRVETFIDEGAEEGPDAGLQVRLKVVQTWTAGQHAVSIIRFFGDGSHLVSGSTDGSVKVWDVFHHHLTHNLKCAVGNVTTAIELSEDGFDRSGRQLLVVGNVEGHVTVFDYKAKRIVGSCRPHTSTVAALTFCEETKSVFTFGCDRKFCVLTVDGSDVAVTRNVVVKDLVSCAVFESSTRVHLGTIDGVVSTFHVHAADPVAVIRRSARPASVDVENSDEELAIRCVALPLLDGHGAIYASDAVYNITTYTEYDDPVTLKLRWSPERTLVGFLDQVLDIRVIPSIDSSSSSRFSRIIATNSKDVRVFAERGCSSAVVLRGHEGIVLTTAVSADGKIVATGSKDKTVRFWSTASWSCIAIAKDAHTDDVSTLSFTRRADTGVDLCVSGSLDENIRVFDVAAIARKASSDAVLDVSAIVGVSQAHIGAVHCSAFAPNDLFLATGGKDKCVNVWNVKGKKLFKEATMKGHKRAVNTVAFSPVDKVAASASNDGTIRLWSLLSFSCIKVLQADKQPVLQAHFFNKGTQMISTTMEGIVRVWAVSSGEVVADVEVHEDKIWALDIVETENDETLFFTGGADGTTAVVEDFTAENTKRLQDQRRETVEQQQILSNAIRNGEFAKAFDVALRLNHPRHLRQVINTWIAKDSMGCEQGIVEIVQKLEEALLVRLLEFTREWLTNARHCIIAAVVVQSLLRGFHFTVLSDMPAIQHILEALWSYARRHALRIELLQRQLYYCDYMCRSLDPTLVTNDPALGNTSTPVAAGADAAAPANGARTEIAATSLKRKRLGLLFFSGLPEKSPKHEVAVK